MTGLSPALQFDGAVERLVEYLGDEQILASKRMGRFCRYRGPYRETRSNAEMRKLLDKKIVAQNSECAMGAGTTLEFYELWSLLRNE